MPSENGECKAKRLIGWIGTAGGRAAQRNGSETRGRPCAGTCRWDEVNVVGRITLRDCILGANVVAESMSRGQGLMSLLDTC